MAVNGRGYSTEFKAQVVADFLGGMSERACQRKHGVTRRTIQTWALQQAVATPEKRLEIDQRQELMLHVYYDSIERIAGVTADGEWLRRQDAEGLAILAGVLSDKASLLVLLRERLARQRALPAGQQPPANVIDV